MSFTRIALGLACLTFAIGAAAQTCPARAVRFVAGSTPGGADVIGADFVAKSAPDGYTWLLAPNSVTVTGLHPSKPPFDVFKDFTLIAQAVSAPFKLPSTLKRSSERPIRRVRKPSV